jgi:two-component system, cell cycle response regulator CtrA
MRLFLHDQNPARRQAVVSALAKVAFRPELLASPETVRALPALSGAAAGLLPLVLGQDDATLSLVTDLRRSGAENAILVVADRHLADRDAALLDAGACDAMSLPLHPGELAARLRAAMRHRNGLVQTEVRVGELVVRLDGRDPTIQSRPVSLSAKENAVLRLLAANSGRVLPRTAIFDLLYGLTDYQPFDKAIDIHICRIRTKLARVAPHARDYIETFPGRGYALRMVNPAG